MIVLYAQGTLNDTPTTIVVALYGAPSTSAVAVASLVILMMALIIALIAHAYRNKLPSQLRRTWYRHHGGIKASSIAILMLLTVWLYSNGQI